MSEKKYYIRVFDDRDVAIFSAVCACEDVDHFLELFSSRDDVRVRINVLTNESEVK